MGENIGGGEQTHNNMIGGVEQTHDTYTLLALWKDGEILVVMNSF